MSCPKCGSSVMIGPKYEPAFIAHQSDSLVYTCMTCGYRERRPTVEQMHNGMESVGKMFREAEQKPAPLGEEVAK